MKKTLWMLGVAVAALTSCTQSEVLDVPESKLIGFETHVDKATRATKDVTSGVNATLNAFYVYGAYGTSDNAGDFDIDEDALNEQGAYYLNGDKSYSTDGAVTWTNANPKSWLANKTFRFAAYADGVGDADAEEDDAKSNGVSFIHKTTVKTGSETEEASDINDFLTQDEVTNNAEGFENLWGLKFTNYSVSTGTKDLVAAIPLEKEVGNLVTSPGHINLTFKHLLAKVRFEFIHNDNSGTSLAIEPFGLTVKDNADCLVIYGETTLNENTIQDPIIRWTDPTADRSLTLFPKDGVNNKMWNSGSVIEEFYVLPQSNDITLSQPIKIHSLDANGNITKTYQISGLNLKVGALEKWMPGIMYRYYAEVVPGGNEIKFSASVTAWNDISSADKEIPTTAP